MHCLEAYATQHYLVLKRGTLKRWRDTLEWFKVDVMSLMIENGSKEVGMVSKKL